MTKNIHIAIIYRLELIMIMQVLILLWLHIGIISTTCMPPCNMHMCDPATWFMYTQYTHIVRPESIMLQNLPIMHFGVAFP